MVWLGSMLMVPFSHPSESYHVQIITGGIAATHLDQTVTDNWIIVQSARLRIQAHSCSSEQSRSYSQHHQMTIIYKRRSFLLVAWDISLLKNPRRSYPVLWQRVRDAVLISMSVRPHICASVAMTLTSLVVMWCCVEVSGERCYFIRVAI